MDTAQHTARLPLLHFSRRLADNIGSRDNSIDHLRLFAAFAVVLGHSWHIALGSDAKVPLQDWTLIGFHSLAVHVFFFLSGLLVTQSAVRLSDAPLVYAKKRIMRIFPALLANALLVPVALVLANAWIGVGPEELARYSLRLVSLISVQYEHVGAFSQNPFPAAINGSVWSLRHEIIVYGVLMIASLFGALHHPVRRMIFMVGVTAYIMAGYIAAPMAEGGLLYMVAEGRHVMTSFLLGVAAHQFAKYVPLHPVMILPGIILLIAGQALGSVILNENAVIWLTCVATLLLAYPARGIPSRLTNDISYGVYIYSWPIQQLTVFFALTHFGVALSPIGLFVLCTGPLILVSWMSWVWIERPALSLVR